MSGFLDGWHQAVTTTLGFFWMALWAFALGYLISSLIQVLMTKSRMQRAMGEAGARSMALGTFFGFISSSCSFAALSTTRALFQKGAGLAPAMAFLLASTNLVIELGIVIAIFLGWQFVVGEYVGGVLLILFAWAFIRITRPHRLVERVRERLDDEADDEAEGESRPDWKKRATSLSGWQQIGRTYVMEWRMVWKDVLIGFTVAGLIAAFVPDRFFTFLFPGSGGAGSDETFWQVAVQAIIGPLAAFCTFIGSMGNIPLAALLYERGVSFAGVMAFIFSDLVVLPVLRINATYYGWRMALYILGMLLAGLVVTALLLHYGLALFDLLPTGTSEGAAPSKREFFAFDYGFVLNLVFLAASVALILLARFGGKEQKHGGHHEHCGSDESGGGGHDHDHDHGGSSPTTWILRSLVIVAVLWLIGGLVVPPLLQ